MHPMLNIAVRAARSAGNLIARNLGQSDVLEINEKQRNDLVTNVDRECETLIIKELSAKYRNHCFIGEESGCTGDENAECRWIIDPIDGTTNFVQGIPHSAVSIAMQRNHKTEVAVVFDPMSNEMFTAARGEGAALNGRRIRVSQRPNLDAAIIATAFPIRYRERMDAYLTLFARLIDSCADIRRMGTASLDLCYTACGRFDGYIEQGLKPWDYAAGELIVREAGGIVTDFMGEPSFNKTGNLVCGNPKILQQLIKICDPQTLPEILR